MQARTNSANDASLPELPTFVARCPRPRSRTRTYVAGDSANNGSFRSGERRPMLPGMIRGVHHIGIRVTDEQRAVQFYARFGFEVVYRDQHDPVIIMKHSAGVELNLVVNAATSFDGKNRLMDVPEKFPGYTHVALRVDSIDETIKQLTDWQVAITEGPKRLGPGMSLFIRDPDSNVIELRQDLL